LDHKSFSKEQSRKKQTVQRWLQTGSKQDEIAYKDYKQIYIKISKEAESVYYQ